MQGTVQQLSISDGGAPKSAVASVEVTPGGLLGDRQRYRKYHGGPERAVCLLGLDVITRLAGEGHPIVPGSVGENVTLAGLDWSRVQLGGVFAFDGGVELEVTSWAAPCSNIGHAFSDGGFARLHAEQHPGSARAYCRVLTPGTLRADEGVTWRAGDAQAPPLSSA